MAGVLWADDMTANKNQIIQITLRIVIIVASFNYFNKHDFFIRYKYFKSNNEYSQSHEHTLVTSPVAVSFSSCITRQHTGNIN